MRSCASVSVCTIPVRSSVSALNPCGAVSGAGSLSVIGVFGSGSTRRSPKVGQRGAAPSVSNSQTGKFESMPPSTITCRWLVGRVLDLDRLEEDRDRHAHPHGLRDLELVRVDAEHGRVAGEHEQLPRAQVGRDHLQPVLVARVVRVRLQLAEGVHALRVEQAAHPAQELAALVEPALEDDAQPLADARDVVLPGRVLEAAEVEREDDVGDLLRGVAGGDQRRGDRAGGGPGDALRLVAALLEHRVGAGQADPLDPAALADEIEVVGEVRIGGGGDATRIPSAARSRQAAA